MRAVVLGVDPGKTTGLAVVRFDTMTGILDNVWSDQLEWDRAAYAVQERLERFVMHRGDPTTVVAAAVERFQVNAKTAQRGQQNAEDSIGMMGVVRYQCARNGIEVGYATASQAKGLVLDDTLRALKLWAPGLTHVNDAMRHAIALLAKKKWMPAQLLMVAP